MKLEPSVIKAMDGWLDALQRAITSKDIDKILRLYESNSLSVVYNWDECPEEMKERYDELIDRANDIIF